MSNWLVAIVGGAGATVVGGLILFYILPSQQAPGLSPPMMARHGPKYLECTMRGGVMDGHRYSFSIDLAAKKAEWAGAELEVNRLTEQLIYAGVRRQFDSSHNYIEFVFNRVTLAVQARFGRQDSAPEQVARCRTGNQNLKADDIDFCGPIPVGQPSDGHCREVARAF